MTDLRPTAEPATATIAGNARALRRRRGMNQTEFADALVAIGVPWKRATVVNFELRAAASRGTRHGRDSVTVGELLGLAKVLRVKPEVLLPELLHPTCDTCSNLPPAGFTCNECGETG